MPNLLRRFIDANKQVSMAIGRVFPVAKMNIYEAYNNAVKQHLSPNSTIYDIGGGKNCPYIDAALSLPNVKVYAIDISDEELSVNSKVSGKIVADVTKEIPLENGAADMLTSRSVLEHLVDQEAFIKNAARIMKKDAYFIHVFPGKFALFAIINQILPPALGRKMLFFFRPESKGKNGFRAYYHKTYYSAMHRLLEKYGFEIVDVKLQFNQSAYFSFFLPFFMISIMWDSLCELLKWKNAAAYLCVVARKQRWYG